MNFIKEIKDKIEDRKLEKKERELLMQDIKELLDKSSVRYSDDFNNRLFYIENSLRKSEPKEANRYEEDDGIDENDRPIIRYVYECPSCKRTVYRFQNYCDHCGQRLMF